MTTNDRDDMDEAGSKATVRLGVVSFLNARPLVEGLDRDDRIAIHYAVPSQLAGMLAAGQVDVALLPVIDLLCADEAVQVLSDACIACDGATMTVRVFSCMPPERIERLYVDGDSHCSVAMAKLIWPHVYGHRLEIRTMSSDRQVPASEPVLLIGDKVVTRRMDDRPWQIDLGQVWKDWTGLPFVFAVWAGRCGREHPWLAEALSAARDRGCARAVEIAQQAGPAHGWPVDLARAYLTDHMRYMLGPREHQAIEYFLKLAVEAGLAAPGREIMYA